MLRRAATGNAALRIAATGERHNQADRMAECVRQGLRKIIEQHGVPACVYGESSSLHLYIGSRSIEGRDANTLEHVSTTVQNHFPQALQVRGVDLMSRCSGVFSYSLRFLSVLPYRGGYVY